MRNLLLNNVLTIPVIFFLLLCFKGGEIAEWVMSSTNLSTWLESNKLGITFSGANYSILPAAAVLAGILALSMFIQFCIETVFDVFDAFTVTRKKESEIGSASPSQEKHEPTVSLSPTESSNEKEKS